MSASIVAPLPERSAAIAQARRELIHGEAPRLRGAVRIEPWILRSWERCLEAGRQPQQRISFEPVSQSAERDAAERNRALVSAARPVIERLSRAIADTRYFAVLTDADGIVIDVGPLPDGTDTASRYARNIARVGVDLSERAVGTSAISTALAEQESVWLHRGEHFFEDTSIYSCAGAPLFGPRGDCIGMLDLTGVQAVERPELRHLATLSARSIENMLVLNQPCELRLHLSWPGCPRGEATDGLLCIDADGTVAGANAAARQMLHEPLARSHALHCNDLFAMPLDMLFDAARRGDAVLEVPLWSGLRVQVRPQRGGKGSAVAVPEPRPRLRDVEAALIRKAVADARGNVAEAARTLGISRATVYRKLWRGRASGSTD
ncbi:GAF domain-containing protein [Variovorax beijingensis]|uniref:GAF domain-containing protein n=1 Tax=Variovorax beijingensis TaxID=2496117 RepID=A0A3P3F164_9BURK|nr:helix-turn-helix domain-containing protein [Variovorax beijingensis]RRH91248.1 GAF domain-containing protein [Variovorax beijingensis]RSZ44514.1 GAF domain-containing protein [Variovorax beijingensis]